jgi:hypothetical protein
MTEARKQQVARILGDEPPTAVVDMTTLRSEQLARETAEKRHERQMDLLGMAMARGLMAMRAKTRAMFLHHARAASKHIAEMGVD